MDIKLRYAAPGIAAALQIGLLLGAGQAAAAEYWLCAKAGTVTMPDSAVVPIWGYVQDDNANLADGCPALDATTWMATRPALTVVPGDTTLMVHLRNDLTLEPTSIVIPGQTATMTPVKFTDGQNRQRVFSFTHEAAANGGLADYTWNDVRPGTYLYHSGSHPQVQVQMGLYGALTKNFAAGPNQAYDGVPYDTEATLLFSEIDPAQHAAIASGAYGNPATPTACQDTTGVPLPMTSTLCYKPKYFLVNGKPFQAGDPPLANLTQGQATLLRMINAGYRAYVPLLQGMHMKMIAEDGNRYQYREAGIAYPRDQYQYSAWLAALKTTDAIVVPSATGSYPIYDRRLNTVTASSQDGGIFGGLQVAAGTPADVAIAKTDGLTSVAAGDPIQYTIVASNAGTGAAPVVTVSDAMPAALTGVTWSCTATAGSSCPATGSGSINAPVSLAAAGSATFIVNGTVSPTASGTLSNTATVTVTPVDPTPTNNSATDSTTILSALAADLGITKTDGLASVVPGAVVSYTVVASNAGPSAATGATVTDTMPAALTNASWSCAASAGSACGAAAGTGNIGTTVDLASGGSATFTVNGTVAVGASGTLVNTATVAVPIGVTDPNGANNSATDTDTIQAVTVVAYFTTTGTTTGAPVTGVAGPNDDADIYAYRSDGTFARVFDASVAPASVPAGANVDAFIYNGPNDIYLSFSNDNTNLPGLAGVQDEDIVHWNGSQWRMFFAGSTIGMAGVAALDVDAFALTPDGGLVFSTTGAVAAVPPVNQQDLWYCAPGSFGFAGTTCVPTLYFDANPDIGLTAGSENVKYAKVMPNGDIQLRTTGAFATYDPPGTPTALSGTTSNVFSCNGATTGAASACASFSNVLTLPATVGIGAGSTMDAISLP
ncbi:MAG: DUF11 domain-containing protein [Rhodocyclales bacterium]|nr:DUF11 domain-containing protein [Rhodocyclales bacterium]